MSNIIDFLESMGQNAQLRHASKSTIEAALIDSQVDESARAAILSKDQLRLEQILGAQTNVCCIVAGDIDETDPKIQMLSARAVAR